MTERGRDEGDELRMPSEEFDRIMRQTLRGTPVSKPGKTTSRSRPKAKRASRRVKK